MKHNNSTPLESLEKLSSLTRGDRAMESRSTSKQTWRGFIFNVGDMNIVFPFMGGYEILPDREIHIIPWAKDWVRGVTNVRGEIYTVVDFSLYLGLAPVTSIRRATMFLLPDTSVKCVLLLEDRVNVRNFPQFAEHVVDEKVPQRLASCLNVILRDDDQDWLVVDVEQLCGSQEFLSIAA
ncbi:MAG: chemotaxis protein CheW [Arenicellales bacterium]